MQHSHIVLEKLKTGYRDKKRVVFSTPQMDFELSGKGLVSLIGPNGIGKSTLIKTLCGIQEPLEGSVKLMGEDLQHMDPKIRAKKIAVVLTQAPASRNLTVAEFVALGRFPYTNWLGSISQQDRDAVKAVMEQTNTLALAQKRCTELSDGQLQRAAIARALAQDTPVILLDEPLTHLDLYHRAAVLKLLKDLATKTSKLILFSTHEIELAIRHSDQMLMIAEGGAFLDTPQQLISTGKFDQLFPGDGLKFDPENRRFEL